LRFGVAGDVLVHKFFFSSFFFVYHQVANGKRVLKDDVYAITIDLHIDVWKTFHIIDGNIQLGGLLSRE
jgi:hypothetical protein